MTMNENDLARTRVRSSKGKQLCCRSRYKTTAIAGKRNYKIELNSICNKHVVFSWFIFPVPFLLILCFLLWRPLCFPKREANHTPQKKYLTRDILSKYTYIYVQKKKKKLETLIQATTNLPQIYFSANLILSLSLSLSTLSHFVLQIQFWTRQFRARFMRCVCGMRLAINLLARSYRDWRSCIGTTQRRRRKRRRRGQR